MTGPGTLRDMIEIWRSERTEDGIGNSLLADVPYYKCRAYVNNLYGAEYWAAAQVNAEETVVFTVRCCQKVREMGTLGCYVLWKGKRFNILSIDNVMNKNETVKIRATAKG